MSSVIFYRFYSNNPSVKSSSQYLSFQGTGITAFELKREIILQNSLGDGSTFVLKIYQDTDNTSSVGEEIKEDTVVIPRSSKVIVKRLPAEKISTTRHGVGSFRQVDSTRYINGRPKYNPNSSKGGVAGQELVSVEEKTNAVSAEDVYEKNMNEVKNNPNLSETEKMAKLMEIEQAQWESQQEALSKIKNVFIPGSGAPSSSNKRKQTSSGNPPPSGYICYGCGSKDHWLQDCPTTAAGSSTLDKAEKEQMLQEMQQFNKIEGGNLQKTGIKKIKKMVGIPQQFLQTVTIDPSKMSMDELATTKLLIDENGNFVKQVEDKKSWELFVRNQFLKNKSNETDMIYNKGYYQNLPRELECALTEGLLKTPVRTSCCDELVSSQAMEDKLIENDFVCPLCGEPDTFIDTLNKDEKAAKKVEEFLKTAVVKK
ncbi:hypothetical protein QEN19_002536 [Hanseniaspora menglaensis]